MEILGVIVVSLLGIGLVIGALFLLVWIVGVSLGGQVGSSANDLNRPTGKNPPMHEGDFRSGPSGYSPNTGYPDSFYGSGGSADDSGGHDEGDFNR